MTNSEISKKIRDLNSRKSTVPVVKLHIEVEDFLSRLIRENGEVETRDIREEILTNLITYFSKNKKSIQVPVSHYIISLAKIQESKGKLAEAKKTLELIVGENDDKYKQLVDDQKNNKNVRDILRNTNLAKAEYRYNVIKFKLGEQSFSETLKVLNDIIDNTELNQDVLGKRMSPFELFKQECSEMVDFERLEVDIFPRLDSMVRGEGEGREHDDTKYTKDLLPSNRLRFIKENFKVSKIYMGKEEFTGYLLFEFEDADLIIAEKFWDENKEGKIRVATENATYILPKDESVELIKKSKSEITSLAKNNDRIQKANHYSKPEDENFSSTYYTNLKTKFNKAIGYEYFKIKPTAKKPKLGDGKKYTGSGKLTPKVKTAKRNAEPKENQEVKQEEKPKSYEEMSKDELIQVILSLQVELSEATGKLKEAIALKTDTKAFSERVIRLMGEVEKVDKMLQER